VAKKQFRFVKELQPSKDWFYSTECRTHSLFGWGPWLHVGGSLSADEKVAQETYVLILANNGGKVVIAEQPLESIP
jgi:hypothetical protein